VRKPTFVAPDLIRHPTTARLHPERNLPRSRTWSQWTPDLVRGDGVGRNGLSLHRFERV